MTYHYNCHLTKWGVNELPLQLLLDKMGGNDLQSTIVA